MADPFDTLGIAPAFDIDLKTVEKQYRELARVLHPDRHIGSSSTERKMALSKAVEVNEAWRLVRDPIRRAEALLRRHGVDLQEGKEPKANPEFLMEMMEQREELSEARTKGNPAAVERLASEIGKREGSVMARIAAGFARTEAGSAGAGAGAVQAEEVGKLVPLLGELRYYRRFLDEVSAIEDGFAEKARAVSEE